MNIETKNANDAFMPQTDERCLCIRASGTVKLENYLTLYIPKIEAMIRKYGEIRMLVYYKDFKGWDEDAALMALGDPSSSHQYMKKLAMVNAPDSELGRMTLTGGFPAGVARIFAEHELETALKWVKS